MNRRYYKFTIHLESPLSLGSGINENSDHDIIRDSRGLPMIPATSIAGVISSDIISDIADEELKKELKNRLFGCIDGKKSSASSVVFYDAVCVSKDPVITIRDSVGLKEDAKVATTGAKFDFEIVETGCDFETFIELDDNVSDDDEDVIKKQLAKLHHGILRFGHKTTRGYGQVSIKGLKKKVFTDVGEWLKFDIYDDAQWSEQDPIDIDQINADDNIEEIHLSLNIVGALSIRSYTTELPEGDKTAPDYTFLSLHNGKPVIPGTTWAGAFRSRSRKFAGNENCNPLFGHVVQGTKETHKSKITFSESIVDGFEEKTVTRNSIDRFSSGTNDGALYTERTFYGGSTELIIKIPRNTDTISKKALFAVIADLDRGYLSVGGLTAVGHGLFEVSGLKIDNEDFTDKLKALDLSALAAGGTQ